MDKLKELICARETREVLRRMPEPVRQKIGRALMLVQGGESPINSKFLHGFKVPVLEIRVSHDNEAYRAVYTVAFRDKVYLLHVFHKKSKSGIGIPPQDLDLIRQRLKDVLALENGQDA